LEYIKEYKKDKFGGGKIAVMGHSTGSQCVLHYLSQANPHSEIPAFDPHVEHIKRPVLDGAIMQAPVSDREAIFWVLKWGIGDTTPEKARAVYDEMESLAREAVARDSKHDTMLPLELTSMIYPANTPISCRRFLSLVSPESPQSPQEDDLFSSDLSDAHFGKTFGMIHERGLLNHKLMVLISGKDQSIPDWVDKDKMLARWKNATDHNGKYQIWDDKHTGVIPNASHALSNDDQAEPRKFLVERVLGYLKTAAEKE
jgi:pimeloyl-ACP methyl ester carboxylesterase